MPPVPERERHDVPDEIRRALYREVQTRVFDTSCRHCHGPEARDQSLIESVFGKVSGAAPVELLMTRLAVWPSAVCAPRCRRFRVAPTARWWCGSRPAVRNGPLTLSRARHAACR
jgi:hypothetical protein